MSIRSLLMPATLLPTSTGDLVAEVTRLKRERNAVIRSHNYQVPEVQNIADYVGDSLGLSQVAARTEADVIVFCGVHFMAETASIISPQKKFFFSSRRRHTSCSRAWSSDVCSSD